MNFKRRVFIIVSCISSLILVSSTDTVFGRGGGGRGSFGRGGSFDRGDFDRGFDHYGSDLGDVHGYADYAHPAEPETRNYNWGDRALSTDNGLAKAAAVTPGGVGHYTPAQLATQGNAVRNAYDGYHGAFDSGWWAAHPNAWRYAGWDNGWGWGSTGWPAIANWWDMPVDTMPVPYDYGNNITYQNDSVYYGSQPMESTVAYFQQAQNLAQTAPTSAAIKSQSEAKNWKPLGVYSLVQNGQSNTDMMFQLAINQKGIIKGNYYNALTEETKVVSGAIDKKSMRAAWIVGGNKNVVYDSGLSNLLKDESSVLVHVGKDKTQQWTLVKLHQEKKEA